MTSIAETLSPQPAPQAGLQTSSCAVGVRVFDHFDAVRADWRVLEAEAPHSGYQRLGWQEAFLRHLGPGEVPCLALLDDEAGQPQALLPFVVRRRAGVTIASFIGGKHSNFGMGLWRPAFAASLTAAGLMAALRQIARQSPMPIDLFTLTNQPLAWGGHANPFALLPHRPSPSFGYHLALGPDGDAVLDRVVSSSSRRKIRRKERSLAEMGALSFVVACEPAAIVRFTDTFLAYKATRFAELGIANVFAVSGMRDFIIDAASGEAPALELSALMVGDEPVALFAGTIAQGRYSGMFNAMIPGPMQKDSPGELLLHHLIRDCCARGLAVFDLGAGEAGYKSHICDGIDPLFDQAIATTAKGAALAAALGALGHAKRRVKQSPFLWSLVGKLRRLRAKPAARDNAA
ncbi:GNAT family N-acetyltransferase [Phreatobacter sp.]|uniref:GNAT family N-acetyltransferase n=1 Tax=Phreatobacter sp. TaxID=1966341 RepID=UPI0025EE3A29|nr:GNAT family N-acetyltransferase [Phreatobacter sp.]